MLLIAMGVGGTGHLRLELQTYEGAWCNCITVTVRGSEWVSNLQQNKQKLEKALRLIRVT